MGIRTIKDGFINHVLEKYKDKNLTKEKKQLIKGHCKNIVKEILSSEGINQKELQKISVEELYSIGEFLIMQKNHNTEEKYEKELLKNGGFDLNIDLGKFCGHECTHCSISAGNRHKKVNMEKLLKKFDNLEGFINKISFYDIGEFFDNENYYELLEYFLKNGINNFTMVSRGISNIKGNNIYNDLKKLKEKYTKFNFNIDLSIDFFSKINEEEQIKSLKIIYNTQKEIFNRNNIGFSLTLPEFEGIGNFKSKGYKEFVKEYTNYINKILKIVGNYNNDLPNENYIYSKNTTPIYIEKIILNDNSTISLRNNIVWAKGRGKNIAKKESATVNMPIHKCAVTEEPYSLNIMNNGDFKLCYQNDVDGCHKFTYANIEDPDFLKKIIKIRTDYYNTIKVLDLIGKGDKHFCASMNLQKNKKDKS